MTNEQIRRLAVTDRLDGILFDIERYEYEAFDAGDVEEACRWFEFAALVRASITLAKKVTP